MITRSGMGTLASGGGIVAAVVCLLVGAQLWLLAAEIGALVPDPALPGDGSLPAGAWRSLIRVSAWLSLLAGGLVILLLIAHRHGSRRPGADSGRPGTDGRIEDVTVRIYEFEGSGASVEITPDRGEAAVGLERPHLAKTVLASVDDESDSILRQIEGLSGEGPDRARPAWRRFLRWFGRPADRS